METILKICSSCKVESIHSLSGKICKNCKSNYDKEYREKNAECRKAHYINYRAKTKDKKAIYDKTYAVENYYKISPRKRNWHLQNKYSITSEDYEIMLKEQNNCCAICNNPDPGRNHNIFMVDHNHETGKVRGLLCFSCNVGLGLFKDDPNIINSAILYLNKYNNDSAIEYYI